MDKELSKMFQEAYGQSYTAPNALPSTVKGRRKERTVTSEKYANFLKKYEQLDKYIDTFTSMDLVYFFREKSRDTGNYYSICNMRRDMGIFKKLLSEYNSTEICTMIEFLFESGQKYLPTADLQPTVLSSAWRVKIFTDTITWVDGKFDPDEKHSKKASVGAKRNKEREWQGKKSGVTMGDWGD